MLGGQTFPVWTGLLPQNLASKERLTNCRLQGNGTFSLMPDSYTIDNFIFHCYQSLTLADLSLETEVNFSRLTRSCLCCDWQICLHYILLFLLQGFLVFVSDWQQPKMQLSVTTVVQVLNLRFCVQLKGALCLFYVLCPDQCMPLSTQNKGLRVN